MNKDDQSETDKAVSGSLKEAIGTITGDETVKAEGTAEKSDGKPATEPGRTK